MLKRAPAEPDLPLATFESAGDKTAHDLARCQAALQGFVHTCVYLSHVINACLAPPDFRSVSTSSFLARLFADMGSSGAAPATANGVNASSGGADGAGGGATGLLRSRLFCMAANRLLVLPAPLSPQQMMVLGSGAAKPFGGADVGSVPFLWGFTKQDRACRAAAATAANATSSQAVIGGAGGGLRASSTPSEQVCFAVSLSKIRLAGVLSQQELGFIAPATVHILVSLVGDNFDVASPAKIGPCRPGDDGTLELVTPTQLFVAATLGDVLYFEVTMANGATGEVKCLGFTSITVAHLVAECLDTPGQKDPAALAQKLALSDVSTQHRALPSGQLEAALWLNGGTFFQRKAPAKKAPAASSGFACCATPAPEASIAAHIAPVTAAMIREALTAAGLAAPKLPDAVADRAVLPLSMFASALRASPLCALNGNTKTAAAGTAAMCADAAAFSAEALARRGEYSFAQPTIAHAAPGGVRQKLVLDALLAVQSKPGAVPGEAPLPQDWAVASRIALSGSAVQPPLFVSSRT